MNGRVDARQIRRWQDEVARDPGSPAFVPLADVYRREGRLEVATRLCLRGLSRQPERVDAHVLLGRVYRESGDLDRALDEMDIALRLDPGNAPARRAIGYICLERRDWKAAARHLEEAARQDPRDERVASALALARKRARTAASAAPREPAEALRPPLEGFVREARVRLAMLLEPSGRIAAQHGFPADLDLAAVASLSAGIHSASGAMAAMLDQPRFQQLYQGEEERQIFMAPVPTAEGELILLAVFGTDTTIGLVRVRFEALAEALLEVDWRAEPRAADPARFEADLAAGLESARSRPPLG